MSFAQGHTVIRVPIRTGMSAYACYCAMENERKMKSDSGSKTHSGRCLRGGYLNSADVRAKLDPATHSSFRSNPSS